MTTEVINIQIREDGSRVVERNIDNIGGAADRAAGPLDRLKGLIATVVTGAALAQLARLADEYTNIQNRLRLVTTGTENLARVTKELMGISNATRTSFTETANLYSRLAASTKDLGLGQQDLLRFTKSVNQAIILSGASAEEAAGGLRQLSQGLASGTLRGDELNSILENLPAVADVIATSLGVTRGQLRALGADGKISAETIIKAFRDAEQSLEAGFATTVPTLGQSFTVLKNNFIGFIGELDQTYGISAKFASIIMTIAGNLDTLIPILTATGIAIAAAFAPGIISAFMVQIRALWALLLANPFVAVGAAIAGVLAYLYLMRDEISLGIDETTTLGDLMRSVWEGVAGVVGDVWAVVKTFFTDMMDWARSAFSDVDRTAEASGKAQESTWLSVLRTVVQVFDMIGGTIRGVMAGVQAVVLSVIAAIMNNFEQLGNAFQAAMNFDGDALLAAVKSNINGYKTAGENLGETFGKAFATEQLRQADSGLESLLDDRIKRAQEIAKERLAAAKLGGDLNGPGVRKPPVTEADADAAKKAAKELERLKNALANVLDQADPVGAATRRLAEAQDILNRSVKAGLITSADAATAYAKLKDQMRDQLDPLAAVNRELDENIALLKLSRQESEIQAQVLQITEQLRRNGVDLTKEETAALKAKLIVEQELQRIARARDQIQASSGGQQFKDFQDQVKAMQQLLAEGREGGGLGTGDVASQLNQMLPWANLDATREQMAGYVQAHADMYAQIAELENAQLINHQTAEMLKAQADVQYMEQRLGYARNFFGTLAGLSSSSNKKLAMIGKAAAIAQATIDGVLAVQKTMASTPYPYNIPLAIAQGAVAAANVAQIASQGVGFRTGGEFTVGGMGGSDSQMVAFRATPGEQVRVNTPAQARAAEQSPNSNVEVPLTIINPPNEEAYLAAMSSREGERVIWNTLEKNPQRARAISSAGG